MTNHRYWIHLARLFLHYRRKEAVLSCRPVRLWVEPTNLCNFACLMCPNSLLSEEERGFMAFDLYKRIIDDAQSFVSEINLAHRGESFLHPELLEMIAYAKDKNLSVRLHTNGSLLTEEISRRLIETGLDRLSFSFDGYDPQTYERIRRGGDFQKTTENIIRFLEMKKETRTKKPKAVIECIDFEPEKKDDLRSAKKTFQGLFQSLPLGRLVIKPVHNWAGHTNVSRISRGQALCPLPWNALTVFWNGDVLPCPQDFFGRYRLGNIKETSLEDIWNGSRMIALRKSLANHDLKNLPSCSRCDHLYRKGFLGVPQDYLWRFITQRMT